VAGRAKEPSADERTRTRGCGQDAAANGDEVQQVPRWCEVPCVQLLLRILHSTKAHGAR
jgi:hypothetical protein